MTTRQDPVHAEADKIEDPLERALFYMKTINGMFADAAEENTILNSEVQEFMCPECGEHTDNVNPCCGIGAASYNEDSINGDR